MDLKKIYIITENLTFANNQKWICDVLVEEFVKYSNLNITQNIEEADIIWIFAKNNCIFDLKKTDNKKIITTIHHVPPKKEGWKYAEFLKYMEFLENLTDCYHVICDKVEEEMKNYTQKKLIKANFWINENIFYFIKDKDYLKQKYNLPQNKLLIGSFQRDCDGKENSSKPKYSKGPDIFINILKDFVKYNKIHVVLTGRMRNYVINNLKENNIEHTYFEMVSSDVLNELYNCLDLYIVSSRVEGGPRAIMEAGITKTPIISTDVGIAKLILPDTNMFDMNNYLTYKNTNAYFNIDLIYNDTNYYIIKNYMEKFKNTLFCNL